jgi:hypothetical protein
VANELILIVEDDPKNLKLDGLPSHGIEVHAPASAATIAGVAHVFEESRLASHRLGFLHGADGDLSGAVRACDADLQAMSAGAFQCHQASDGGMDGATTHRGVRAGREPSAI